MHIGQMNGIVCYIPLILSLKIGTLLAYSINHKMTRRGGGVIHVLLNHALNHVP
jgi:hypothetical protein